MSWKQQKLLSIAALAAALLVNCLPIYPGTPTVEHKVAAVTP